MWTKKNPKTYYDVKRFLSDSSKNILVNQGGTRSGKTYSTYQALVELAYHNRDSRLSEFITYREFSAQLADTVQKDLEDILLKDDIPFTHNKTLKNYQVFNTTFKFRGLDRAYKVRGAAPDIAFFNEVNAITSNDYKEASLRVTGKIIADYNPTAEFWIYDDLLEVEADRIKSRYPEVQYECSTYLQNPFCPERVKKNLEKLKERNFELYKVYGLGQLGKVEGLIYPEWDVIPGWPDHLEYFGYGLDFGFSSDPTAVVKCAIEGDTLYVDELIHETGLHILDRKDNQKSLEARLNNLQINKNKPIISDSARPDSISDLNRAGFLATPVKKGADSLESGINKVKAFKIKVTARSLNLINELKLYIRKYDQKFERYTEPVDANNHCLDALRYWVMANCQSQAIQISKIDYSDIKI